MADHEFAVQFEKLSEEEITRRRERGHIIEDIIRIKPGNIIFPGGYRHLGKLLYNFQFRSDDIVLLTFPKSGTHWMYEVLWTMKNINQLHTAEEPASWDGTFFLEQDMLISIKPGDGSRYMERFSSTCGEARLEDGVVLQVAAAHQGPRLIYSHLQLHLLNPTLLDTCKVIYLARNIKDVCVSFYHQTRKKGKFTGEFPEFVESVQEDQFYYGSYWDHIRQAWHHRDNKNFHFVFYEDLKSDGVRELRKLSNFLNLDLSQDQLMKVVEHTSFDAVKARASKKTFKDPLNRKFFLRSGQIGDWKNVASKDLDARMDAWIKDNSQDLNITFRYK